MRKTSSASSSASTPTSPPRSVFSLELVERSQNSVVFLAHGKRAAEIFRDEAGGHRWQRVPPNEKRGRVHTSTVTVAVLPDLDSTEANIDPRDVEIQVARGSGPGGQHRNKTESCVVVKHRPTGVTVRCEETRSQQQNRELALTVLRSRVWEIEQRKRDGERASRRRQQVGSGMRGDKRRTVRTQDGVVNDHVTGRKWTLKKYLRGDWS